MQLVLSKNRIIAHGENFLAMGGVVINTETGAKYENATIAECEGCPSDINKVGYEYHAGVFVPCAPYGVGNNNGYFMEVCETCATPRSSGIPVKFGLGRENLSIFPLIWENASPGSNFGEQTITFEEDMSNFVGFIVVVANARTNLEETQGTILGACRNASTEFYCYLSSTAYRRTITVTDKCIDVASVSSSGSGANKYLIPLRIYGVKL